MSFDEIWGQEPAIQTLKRALESGRVHHAYRFEGPPGVGKEMAARRFARALVCERGGLGCGECSACRRAMTLSETLGLFSPSSANRIWFARVMRGRALA